jgi:hypothetical protein
MKMNKRVKNELIEEMIRIKKLLDEIDRQDSQIMDVMMHV